VSNRSPEKTPSNLIMLGLSRIFGLAADALTGRESPATQSDCFRAANFPSLY
jgi:hypothetical protein